MSAYIIKKLLLSTPYLPKGAFILVFSTCLCLTSNGQKQFGFVMPENQKKIQIPFETHNNLIVIPVTINQFLTLRFILDTGVETAILTEKLYADVLQLSYLREIIIAGPGIIDSVQAYVANAVTFTLADQLNGTNMNLLVLKEDYLQLSENLGEDAHGIIGYDVFKSFVVEINYDDELITLYDPAYYKKKKKAIEVPLRIDGNKPFLEATIVQEHKKATLHFMVDTGASHAALIDYQQLNGIEAPQEKVMTRLGRGIAGDIPGYVGRMDSLDISCFDFQQVLVSAPFEGAYNKVIKRGARVGTFGGDLLSRFNVTFDYQNRRMYLRKGDKYKNAFEYDMSGLSINATGANLDSLVIVSVDPSSPACHAGIKKDDIVLSVNGRSLKTDDLGEISRLLRSRDGKRIQMKIQRSGETLKKKFSLKKII